MPVQDININVSDAPIHDDIILEEVTTNYCAHSDSNRGVWSMVKHQLKYAMTKYFVCVTPRCMVNNTAGNKHAIEP